MKLSLNTTKLVKKNLADLKKIKSFKTNCNIEYIEVNILWKNNGTPDYLANISDEDLQIKMAESRAKLHSFKTLWQ